jgi:hypothetical protein
MWLCATETSIAISMPNIQYQDPENSDNNLQESTQNCVTGTNGNL